MFVLEILYTWTMLTIVKYQVEVQTLFRKKFLGNLFGAIVMLFLLSSSAVGVLTTNIKEIGEVIPSNDDPIAIPLDKGTHTVFGEYATATTCGYCKYAHGALKEIYAEGLYEFYYVSHVANKNIHANQRLHLNYNIYGYPTIFFDGGYQVKVGAGSIPSAKAAYISAINVCGARAVPDIEASLTVIWVDDATMDITITVQNNDVNDYVGTLRVFVTEIESTLGWKDTAGYPYTFPFLEYAFNQDIQIPAGETWQGSTLWDGHDYNSGYGQDFGSITRENTMVIAAVYNEEWHQGYAYPPNQNPFDAYYVDETTAVIPTLAGDANADGTVNIDDLFFVLGHWGEAGGPADVNNDGTVNIDDIFYVLGHWT